MGQLTVGKYVPSALTEIANEINGGHRLAIEKAKDALQQAKEVGDLLLAAKAQLPHGQWLSWLTENCEVTSRQAQRYMRVAENWSAIEKNDSKSHLTIDSALAEIAQKERIAKWAKQIESLCPGKLLYRHGDNGTTLIFRAKNGANYYHLYAYWFHSEDNVEMQQTKRPISAEGIARHLCRQGDDLEKWTEGDDDGSHEFDYDPRPGIWKEPLLDFHSCIYDAAE